MSRGEFNHVEIPADDTARAKRFYGALLGWQFEEMEGFPDYHLFRSGPGELGGAIGKRGESAGTVLRAYVTVDAIDPALEVVRANGGRVKTERTEIQGQGWYAVIDDPEGNEIGLYEFLPSGAA
jgi:predicted enzyme related to lactoylglutathione lyase